MSVEKRGKTYSLRIRPFGEEQVTVRTTATTKREAERIEQDLLVACRAQSYEALDVVARAVCLEMFRNRKWAIPADLGQDEQAPEAELTLWRATEIFLNYPGVKDTKARERHISSLKHIVQTWGKDKPVRQIWVPDIRLYQQQRIQEGAKPDTVNRECGTISRLFSVLAELQQVESNPARLVKGLSAKSGERQVFIGHSDFVRIVRACPPWYQPVAWCAYYTGMRRGELETLSSKSVRLSERMIVLSPENTKEASWKRIPIHKDLVPILGQAMRVSSLETDRVFLVRDGKGTRPLGKESIKNPWPRALDALDWPAPRPRFHDIRATWKTCARRSGVDEEIRMAIMGHGDRTRSVKERYGRISDQELLRAVDKMFFDHGPTEILVNG